MARSRTTELVKGVNATSKSQTVKKTARYRFRGRGGAKKTITKAASTTKVARFYPADDVSRPKSSNKTKHGAKTATLRSSIVPGSVLILLAGRFRGKRVVFLKQLSSGCLLVTGPYKVNGVPLRRVNQAYVISTSTQVNITGVAIPDIDDEYFARQTPAGADGEARFFNNEAPAKVVTDEKKATQAALDTALIANLSADERAYLNARFSLSKGDRPHEMRF